MNKSLLLSTALCSVCSLSFAASLQTMDKEQVTKTLEDKTITTINLVTMNEELVQDTATVYFDNYGTVTGKFKTKPQNNPQDDQGKYEITDKGGLCVTWQHWNKAKPICVEIYNLKNGYLFINKDTNKFETFVLKDSIKFGNQMK